MRGHLIMSGTVTAGFSAANRANLMTDQTGPAPSVGWFEEDLTQMHVFGTDLATRLRIAGRTPADLGAYSVSIDPASYRQ